MTPDVLSLISEMPHHLQTILILAMGVGGYKGGARGIQAIQSRRNGSNGNGHTSTRHAVEGLIPLLTDIRDEVVRNGGTMESVRDTVRDLQSETQRVADIQLASNRKFDHMSEMLVEVRTKLDIPR